MTVIFRENQIRDKKQAKNVLTYAAYKLRHSSAKRFELIITIKELPDQ